MQYNCVIYYESKKIKECKKHYANKYLGLAAIIHALKMWRHYLMGNKFELKSDHHSLKYLFKQLKLNALQARWMELVRKFNFEIKHIKGKKNQAADALSRRN